MYLSKENLILKLRHYCAYQDRCQSEVEQKLRKLGADEEMEGEVILHLLQEGFLNEERFAKSYARGKFRHLQWGRIKIRAGLQAKKVSEPLLKIAMMEIDENEYRQTLHQLLERDMEHYGDKSKVIQHLLAKGFEYELILESMKSM